MSVVTAQTQETKIEKDKTNEILGKLGILQCGYFANGKIKANIIHWTGHRRTINVRSHERFQCTIEPQ